MREVWLKPNRRALATTMLGPGLLLIIGVGTIVTGISRESWVITLIGGGLAMVGGLGVALVAYAMTFPRVAYEEGKLLVYLGEAEPFRIPIELVEVFFLGQGPVRPSDEGQDAGPKTANVVVRLAEAAPQWHERKIRPDLGKWYDGYIVIRGTWCEPVSHERLNVLNHRLAEIRRDSRRQESPPT